MSFIIYFTHKLDTLILALITMYSINTEEIICRCKKQAIQSLSIPFLCPLQKPQSLGI